MSGSDSEESHQQTMTEMEEEVGILYEPEQTKTHSVNWNRDEDSDLFAMNELRSMRYTMLPTCIRKLQITRRRNSGPGQSEKGKIDNSIAFDHLKDERDTTDFTVSSS